MNQEQFEMRLREMFMSIIGDREYERKEAEANNVITMAILDATRYAGGSWKDDIAAERLKQWEWFHGTINKPEVISLPEPTLHRIYKEYLRKRGYAADKIPETDSRTPDFIVKGGSYEYLNEFKSPELVFNSELNVYKFQTTHSKILTFISKAVKQLDSADSDHSKPWMITFASTHSQLNWTDFVQTLQGGVAYDNKLSPDFTKTDMFKRVISKARKIDLYVWLQVSPNGESIFQVSLIANNESRFKREIEKIVIDLKQQDVSSMDNLLSLDWPS